MWVSSWLLLLPCIAHGAQVEVPVDVGVGPAAYFISGPVYRDQPVHFGLKISVEAVIDQETLRKFRNQIPAQYRDALAHTSEVRFSPSIFIPDALIISPKIWHTGLYGITWKPFSVGLPLTSGVVRTTIDAGVLLTAFYLQSDTLPSTFFARPGLELKLESEVFLSRSVGVSVGWASGFYVPQELGTFIGFSPFSQVVWHLGQAFLKVHYRFPFETRL